MFSTGRLMAAGGAALAADSTISYKKGSYHIIPKKYTVGKRIAVRSYLDRNRTELSDRTYMPQKAWFEPYTPKKFQVEHQKIAHNFYDLETKLIWSAFDTPELIGILLHDETIKGAEHLYDAEFLESALHWTRESRYWRCIGITKPFYNKSTLRSQCWHDRGLEVGTLVFSQAMREALMDLERARRRKELGLEPNYVWDRWGPIGFIDGARTEHLPRFAHNPYIDPDGVEVTEVDVAPFNTHEQIKERYSAFIDPDLEPFKGVFAAPSHGALTLDDIPQQVAVKLYRELMERAGTPVLCGGGGVEVAPADMRAIFYLSAFPESLKAAQELTSWTEVREMLTPRQEACDEKVDALRLLENTRHDPARVRSFYEEKCGFFDFMYTSDKVITAAVLCYLQEVHRICTETEWGKPLARCLTDLERVKVMGNDAFILYRHIEDAILDRKRRVWATRFAGEANEESTLDYLLENFGRRTEQTRNVGTTGTEFDREQEPIGRQVQRRVLDSDKASKLAEVRQKRGKMWSSKKSVFDSLHQKQLQNVTYGVR
uniref:Uncharacterized protein n=1 Tax=Trypanosoma congolense (strain IL3000) TaxID=1068625 RepID=G0UV72_TRYCI|nr:conserved hypothetical protein [Trypanosoma congolense IL3000]